ncbi:Gfo/Idh/MocA family oxidoreductase [Geminicoccaceae bacterium 1502E]|nr:Gfo/Idh/MocA family oxidoreductase [Geminicoccaceae bacterium 1502E]
MAEIGIGLIGTGFMGQAHALAFGAVAPIFEPPVRPRLELVADLDPAAAERTRQRHGFARATADWRTLVEDPRVGLVSVTSPNALHKEMALAAIAAGKHVYCEKPLALTAADASQLADAAEAAGVCTLVGYNYLRSPAIAYARRLVERGELGRPTCFRAIFDEDYMADPDIPHSWRVTRAQAGSGALGDMASHVVSLARFLVGGISAVAGQLGTAIRERPMPATGSGREERAQKVAVDRSHMAPVENEDLAQALLRFSCGAAGYLGSSRIAWGRKNGLDLELYGTGGALRFTQERFNELQLFRPSDHLDDNGFRTVLTGPAHPPFGRFTPAVGHGLGFNDLKVIEVAHLLAAIAGETPAFPDFREGAAIEAVCEAIERSHEQQGWVAVAPA